MNSYKTRVFDQILLKKLKTSGAVLIRGAKWCGKTTTAIQTSKSTIYMDEPRSRESNMLLAKVDPYQILAGATPRLIDEWQIAPQLWDAVRFQVDRIGQTGLYILTGSSVPADMTTVHHSGAGRIARMTMRPMALYESGESSGTVSLADIFSGNLQTQRISPLSLQQIAFLICRGGWPQSIDMEDEFALRQAFEYIDAVAESDMSRVDGIARQPATVRNIMRSLARLQGTASSITTISADISQEHKHGIHSNTLYSYLAALAKNFVTEDMEAWCPNLRSKAIIRTSPTRYFTDPSIAIAAMKASPADLINDLPTMGMLFEALAVRDLRTYAESLNGNVFHYHDSTGLECDAVIHLDDGRYGLIEIKIGGDRLVEEGARSLNKLESVIDTKNMKSPSFKLVLTAVGDLVYRRPDDGVMVCPVSTLRP